MGYFKQEMYGIICNSCEEGFYDWGGQSMFRTKEQVEQSAIAHKWLQDEGESWRCPNCFSFDEKGNLIIKNRK